MNTPTTGESQSNHAANWWRAVREVRKEGRGEALAGYLFIGPAVLLFVVFNAYPIFRGIVIAFSDYRYLVPGYAPFNGIDNWREMAQDHVFWESLRRSLEYMAIYIGFNFLLAFLVALLITEIKSTREAGVYRAIAYLPVVLPIAVAVLVWKQLVNAQFGYIDVLAKSLFHLAHTPDLFHDARWSVPILAIITVWKAGGTSVLLMLVGLYSINTELYEAAALDGAGWWRSRSSSSASWMPGRRQRGDWSGATRTKRHSCKAICAGATPPR